MFDINELLESLAKELFSDNLKNSNPDTLASNLAAKVGAQVNALGIGENSLDYSKNIGMSGQLIVSGEAGGSVTGARAGAITGTHNSIDPKKLEGDKRFPKEFLDKVMQVCSELNIRFDHLMVAMAFETGGTFSPSAVNRQSGATGLIQFMPSTAVGLGTTTSKLAAMNQVEQMDYVKKYLVNKNLSGRDFSDIYMSILFPYAVGRPSDFILFGKGALKNYTGKAYTQNRGLDLNKDGSITKGEASSQAWDRGIGHFRIK